MLEKLDKRLADLEELSGNVKIMSKYKKAKTDKIIVIKNE